MYSKLYCLLGWYLCIYIQFSESFVPPNKASKIINALTCLQSDWPIGLECTNAMHTVINKTHITKSFLSTRLFKRIQSVTSVQLIQLISSITNQHPKIKYVFMLLIPIVQTLSISYIYTINTINFLKSTFKNKP